MDAVPLSESVVHDVPSGGVLGQKIVAVTAMWSANTAQVRHVIEVSVPLSGGMSGTVSGSGVDRGRLDSCRMALRMQE